MRLSSFRRCSLTAARAIAGQFVCCSGVCRTGAMSSTVPNCSGHIDRRIERCGDNPASVVKVIARKVHFLAIPAIARIRLIWQTGGKYSEIVSHSG